MNRRLVTILLAAFVVAALCSVLVYRLVGMRIAAVKPQPSTRVVLYSSGIHPCRQLTISTTNSV